MAGNCLTQRWICRLHHGYALIELANCCFSFLIRWLLRITKKKAFSCWALIAHEHKNMIHNATIIGFFLRLFVVLNSGPDDLSSWIGYWQAFFVCHLSSSDLHFGNNVRSGFLLYMANMIITSAVIGAFLVCFINEINIRQILLIIIIWRMLICTHLLITTDHHCDCYEISEYVFAVQIWFRIFWIWFEGILGWRRKIPLELRPIHMQILCIRDRIEANESKIWTFISHRYAVECNFAMVDEKREWNFYFADKYNNAETAKEEETESSLFARRMMLGPPPCVRESLYFMS